MDPSDSSDFPIPPELPSGDYGGAFLKMFGTLIFLVILLWATVWFLRRLIQQRFRRGVGVQAIQVLEKKMISPKTMLYFLEVEGKKILIAESHLEIEKIETIDSSPR